MDAWLNTDWFDAMAMLASFPAVNELDTGPDIKEGWIIPATAVAIREISSWDNLSGTVLPTAFDEEGGGSVWLTVMPLDVVLSFDNSRECTLTKATHTDKDTHLSLLLSRLTVKSTGFYPLYIASTLCILCLPIF